MVDPVGGFSHGGDDHGGYGFSFDASFIGAVPLKCHRQFVEVGVTGVTGLLRVCPQTGGVGAWSTWCMNKTQIHPSSKDAALHSLGVVSAKKRKALAGQVEFVQVRPGRQIVAQGRLCPTVVVGVAGAALATRGDGNVAQLESSFVVDSWATDSQGVATVTVVAVEPTTLVLIDRRRRAAVFAAIPALAAISAETYNALEQSKTPVIDLTEVTPQPQLINS